MFHCEKNIIACPVCDNPRYKTWRIIKEWPIVECIYCHMKYVNPMPSEESILKAYSLDKREYEEFFQTTNIDSECILGRDSEAVHHNAREILSLLNKFIPEAGSVLEVGCSAGVFLEYAFKAGWKVHGVDPGNWVNSPERDGHLGIQRKSLFEAELKENYFDAVYCGSIIEHLTDPKKYLAKIHSVTKPGGYLIIKGLPNVNSFSILLNLDKWIGNHPPLHLLFFSKATIKRLLARCGFKIISLKVWGIPETVLEFLFNTRRQKYTGDYTNILYKKNRKAGFLRLMRGCINIILDFSGLGSVIQITARKE